jgi:Fe2+ transport system protein FeoA
MLPLIPLSCLHAGESGRVGQVVGPREEVRRLEELGFRGGVTVEMVTPGAPCIVRLGGNKLCFRANEALHVFVQPGAPL